MLKLDIDIDGIAKQFKEMALEVEQDLKKGVANLAAVTHAKILEDSQQELNTSREKYARALNEVQEVLPGIFLIALDESAMWIEEGIPPDHDMKPSLLKNAKTSSEGKRYKVIPFEHDKQSSEQTERAQDISSKLRRELKKRGVPFKKIEYNQDGSPRLGKIHEFDFASAKPGRGNTQALKGVSIYQSMVNGKVRRNIMTFRTVTDGPGSEGKWIHPGMEAKHYFEKALDWATKEWEQRILPEILDKWK